MLYVNTRKPSLNVQSDSIFVMFSNSFSQLFVFSHCFLTPIFATFYILLLSCQSCQVINSFLGLLCRKTIPREREDTRVWYRETMFSQTVSWDFPLHEYFLYLVSAPPPKKTRRHCEPEEGYLCCSKRFDHESLYIFSCSSLSQLMMLALGNSEKCSRCIQTHTP